MKLLPLLAICLFISSCASDGRDLAEAGSDKTTTTRQSSTSALESEVSQDSGFEIASVDFTAGGPVPVSATCTGGNNIPNLTWENVPNNTVELVLTLVDYTDFSKPSLLWQAGNLDPALGGISGDTLPEDIVITKNSWGTSEFGSTCIEDIGENNPDQQRDLQFRIYALDTESGLQADGHGDNSWNEVRAKATESAAILMRYDAAGIAQILDDGSELSADEELVEVSAQLDQAGSNSSPDKSIEVDVEESE